MKVFIGAGDKRCDWLLEYDDKESNDRALICLHNKKFGLHTIKPAIINEASVIPGISYVLFINFLLYILIDEFKLGKTPINQLGYQIYHTRLASTIL